MQLVDDTSRNPESDTFHYIYTIIESLNKLGRLEDAVDALEQRLPVELFKVVEKSKSEVQQRHQRNSTGQDDETPDLDSTIKARQVVLDDLLSTLFARFEAIAESHRVLHEVLVGVSRREGNYHTQRLTRGFKELWKLYQSEIRSLLHDYLSNDGSASERNGHITASEGNIFQLQRDRNKVRATINVDTLNLIVAIEMRIQNGLG